MGVFLRKVSREGGETATGKKMSVGCTGSACCCPFGRCYEERVRYLTTDFLMLAALFILGLCLTNTVSDIAQSHLWLLPFRKSVAPDVFLDPFDVVVYLGESHVEPGAGLPAEGDNAVLLEATAADVANKGATNKNKFSHLKKVIFYFYLPRVPVAGRSVDPLCADKVLRGVVVGAGRIGLGANLSLGEIVPLICGIGF